MELEIRHLRLVTEIASTGSMTRAAARLYLTQSALSHQLRDIESRLKTPLFLRLGKRMVPTAAGRRVLESASRVLDDLHCAEDDVRRISGETDGVVRVCTQCNTGYHWLPPLLTAFHRKYPKVSVSVLPDATSHPVEQLLAGRLDLAILTDEVNDPRLRLRPLFSDEMVAIVAPSHRWTKSTWISPADLASAHLLLYTSTPESSFTLNKVLAPLGLVPARVSFIMLTEAMIEMARAGLGVGVLPRWSAQGAIAARRIVPLSITRKGVRRRWTAATLKAQADPQYLVEFIELLADRALPARRLPQLRDISA